MSSWKRDFASGLIVLVPILVTLYVIYWLFIQIAGFALAATQIENPYTAVALTILVFVLLVLSIGYMMRTAVGGFVEELVDGLINRLPVLRIIYNASKMAVETVLSDDMAEFKKPVRVETWNGLRMTAFKTGNVTDDGREVVFIPTSPNITTGFVVEVDSEEIMESEDDVEDALTRVVSAGFGQNEEDNAAVGEYVEEVDSDSPTRNDDSGSTTGENP